MKVVLFVVLRNPEHHREIRTYGVNSSRVTLADALPPRDEIGMRFEP
jgi:hypothetical protein